jgi:hypothetical protein
MGTALSQLNEPASNMMSPEKFRKKVRLPVRGSQLSV